MALASNGIARTADLLEHGWSRHGIAKAVARDELIRVRKGWVARPSADPELLLAAQHGLLIACVTAAARLGLWATTTRQHHLSVRTAGSERRPRGAILHWRRPLIPRPPGQLEEPVENVLDQVAHCLPREEAVAVWDSALNQGLVSYAKLDRLPYRGRAREVRAQTDRFADSGLESYVRLRLRWLRVRIVPQAWVLGHRVDFLIEQRLVLQVDGGSHVGGQRGEDNRHDAELRLRGYAVIRVGYREIMEDWPAVQALIMQAIAQDLHLAGA